GAGGADEIGALGSAFDAMTARLRRRIEMETLVSQISRRFIDLPPEAVDAAIGEALGAIGLHAGVERARVFAVAKDGAAIRMTHEWRSPDPDLPDDETRDFDGASYPWLLLQMRALRTVHAPDLVALPPEARVDAASWRARGVRSLIRVPMSYRGALWGYVGFDARRDRKAWSDEDIGLLQVVGEIFCQTLARKASEAALEAERERLAVTLRSIGDGVITTDTEGRVALVNPVAEALTGWPQAEAAGQPLDRVCRLLPEPSRQAGESPVAAVLRSGGSVNPAAPTSLVARDGTRRAIADSAAPIRDAQGQVVGMVLVFRDITERRRLEDELQKAEKLRSVGVLAGGIAHDFNNLLTGILGNASLARSRLAPDDPVARKLQVIEKATERAAELTRQLLTFAKGGAPVKASRHLADLIVDSAEFSLRGSAARCEFALAGDLWPAEVDGGQISQVIGNLVLNAGQAMPGGGTIRVTAENLRVDPGANGGLAPGRYVRLAVADEGVGIRPEDLPRVFDPYFTTKAEGSGLGLATSHSIVRQHGGRIEVRSELGVGTTFTLYLPAGEGAEPQRAEPGAALPRGAGRILVMDDQPAVREVAAEILEAGGYSVGFARDGAELLAAYAAARDAGAPYHAVIMDLTVPGGMGGREAMARLRELDPGAVAIVASGYSNDPVMADHRAHGFRAVVAKPFGPRDLVEAVGRALAGG
ncbi:MAG: hybrid sensor histidine kinase/response regulator, partial [Deferrisomatales bacterium]